MLRKTLHIRPVRRLSVVSPGVVAQPSLTNSLPASDPRARAPIHPHALLQVCLVSLETFAVVSLPAARGAVAVAAQACSHLPVLLGVALKAGKGRSKVALFSVLPGATTTGSSKEPAVMVCQVCGCCWGVLVLRTRDQLYYRENSYRSGWQASQLLLRCYVLPQCMSVARHKWHDSGNVVIRAIV